MGSARPPAADEPRFGTVLFASSPHEPRSCRPTDVAMVIVSCVLLLLLSVLSHVGAALDQGFSDLLAAFPDFFHPLWLLFVWSAPVWAVTLFVVALVRRRGALARDMVAGAVISILVAAFLGAVVGDDGWAVVSKMFDLDGPPAFPPGLLVLSAAAIAVASPHLSRPFRHLGRWLLAAQLVGTTFLDAAEMSGALIAIAVGLLAASIVHLLVGSPGGRPTVSRVQYALRELGIDVHDLTPTPGHTEGVVRFTAADTAGPLDIKVYGRDAWDAELLANLWRLAWYRGHQRAMQLSRVQLVEHEGFMTLFAERAGVRAPRLVTAGSAGQGDALVVVRPDGAPLDRASAAVGATDDALDGIWRDLDRLHDAGMAHGRIDLGRMVVRADGSIGFGDLSSASLADTDADELADQAQALALAIALAGQDRGIESARRQLGDDAVLRMLPYLQDAALPNGVRDLLDDSKVDLDDVRKHIRELLGAPEQEMIKLRRVSAGSILNLALLAIAAYVLIGAFSDVDWDSFTQALRDASWWWLAFALVLAQLARVPGAISTMGSIKRPLPVGPLTALEFAICYVNLAIPSTAARVAIKVRFFQRFGVKPTVAMTSGVIDSVSGFVVQIGLFLGLFFWSDIDFGFSSDTSSLSGLGTVVLIVLIVLVVAIAVVILVAPVRRRVLAIYHQIAGALGVLRSPRKLLQLFLGNLLNQVVFAIALSACVEAFGASLPLTELILINTVVSLFAGLLPIPGGIGVSEAGLTLGLTAAGLSSEIVFAIALAYRMVSFYLPPIWGYFSYRWLVKRRYL